MQNAGVRHGRKRELKQSAVDVIDNGHFAENFDGIDGVLDDAIASAERFNIDDIIGYRIGHDIGITGEIAQRLKCFGLRRADKDA
jgi:hypothetical protein